MGEPGKVKVCVQVEANNQIALFEICRGNPRVLANISPCKETGCNVQVCARAIVQHIMAAPFACTDTKLPVFCSFLCKVL